MPHDDPEAFDFSSKQGTVVAKSLPLRAAHACPPQGYAHSGQHRVPAVDVVFRPKLSGPYLSRFRFEVSGGESFDVLLRGFGSYEEDDDMAVRMVPRPSLAGGTGDDFY